MPDAPRITSADLAAAADLAHDEDKLPTPESAGFEENAILDFLQSYPAFKVPDSLGGEELAHPGSLMAGLAIGAVAARKVLGQHPHSEPVEAGGELCVNCGQRKAGVRLVDGDPLCLGCRALIADEQPAISKLLAEEDEFWQIPSEALARLDDEESFRYERRLRRILVAALNQPPKEGGSDA